MIAWRKLPGPRGHWLLGALPRREFRSLEAVEFSLEADAQDRARASQESPRVPGVRGT